jgi:hypothetical protein
MHVGQKVVCINDEFPEAIRQFYTALPVKDVTYVVRQVCVGINPRGEAGEVCLYLVGLHNPRSETPPFPERGFSSERFRPLEEIQNENRQKRYDHAPVFTS